MYSMRALALDLRHRITDHWKPAGLLFSAIIPSNARQNTFFQTKSTVDILDYNRIIFMTKIRLKSFR